jgi:hypothetical protein
MRSAHITLIAIVVLFPASLAAQSAPQPQPYHYNGNGYAFGSIGACQHGYALFGGGGGGAALLWKGFALGVDAGAYRFSDGWSFGLVHPTIGWHFVNRNIRARNEFFVNFGPGAVFGVNGGVGPSGTLGAGAIHWAGNRVGIRWEVRAHGLAEEGILVGRIGVSFR